MKLQQSSRSCSVSPERIKKSSTDDSNEGRSGKWTTTVLEGTAMLEIHGSTDDQYPAPAAMKMSQHDELVAP